MPIEFSGLRVRIVSPAIQKQTRKNSTYRVAIIEVPGSKQPDHWYANAYPTQFHEAGGFDHVEAFVLASVGEEIEIDGNVRKFQKGNSQHVVIDVTHATEVQRPTRKCEF